MSTLIRIQFSPRYLDFEIPESCRGSGDSSRLQDVMRLDNLDDCSMPQKAAARGVNNFYLINCCVRTVCVHIQQFLVCVSQCGSNVHNSHGVNFIHCE